MARVRQRRAERALESLALASSATRTGFGVFRGLGFRDPSWDLCFLEWRIQMQASQDRHADASETKGELGEVGTREKGNRTLCGLSCVCLS